MDDLPNLQRFAAAVREHHLAAEVVAPINAPAYVQVRNTVSPRLVEQVTCSDDGTYLTGWGYRLGDVDDVPHAAARLGYLLAAVVS